MYRALNSKELKQEISRYISTGEYDPAGTVQAAGSVIEGLRAYSDCLRRALVDEVRRRERGCREKTLPGGLDPITFSRRKLSPIANGLFPATEREKVMGMLERSVIFLTKETVHQCLNEVAFLRTAWKLADIYLGGLEARCLSGEEESVVGMSEGTNCYVSMAYFEDKSRFSDYIVHEAAHIFHNTKRKVIGLPFTRYREWLLDIAFSMRETFAYACEVYNCIVDRSKGTTQPRQLLAEYLECPMPVDDRVDHEELLDILAEAVAARNGWKRILRRCSNARRPGGHRRL